MEKELKIKTSWTTQTTEIQFGINFIFSQKFDREKTVIITDTHIEKLYREFLEKLDVKVFSFEAGEPSKTRETKQELEDNLLSHNFGRDARIIGLGGGVVADISGFLASTYCRGIPHIQIPTSLLGMVDAAIGGKCGVNTPYGKNLIGAFHPPEEIWIDGKFLETLPKRQWINGLVEMIKAGLIASPSLFEELSKGIDRENLDFLMERIYECVSIKKDAVENDPEELKGQRRILNLGHTFGHALETLENFQIEHGEAVAIGILASCFLSQQLGYLNEESFEKVRRIFEIYEVPLIFHNEHTLDSWVSTLVRDKKAVKASPRFVLIDKIGNVLPFDGEYCTEIEFPLLEKTLEWIHENFYRPSE